MEDIVDYKKNFKLGFAKRLYDKLQEKGYVSTRGAIINGKILAEKLNISLTTINCYLNGKSIPKNVTLQRIAKWLDVEPLWLLYGEHTSNITHTIIDRSLFFKIFMELFPLLRRPNLTKKNYIRLTTKAIEIYCLLSQSNNNKNFKNKDQNIATIVKLLNNNS